MALHAVNLANGQTDEKGIFRLLGKIFNQSGVIEATGLTVAAQSTPDMTVKVSGSAASDNAVFLTSTGDCYHGWNTASHNVTIPANASGATRYDAIVAYIDTGAGSVSANNPNGLKIIAVRSTNASPATSGDITASAVGTKPYIRLADVLVGNGVSSINSGNITDARPFATHNRVREIHLPFGVASGSNTSYTTLDPSRTTIDFAKFGSLTAAYFVATGNVGAAGTLSVQLVNLTDGAIIASSEITTTSTGATEFRSGDIKANLPATSKLLAFQAKGSSGAWAIYRTALVLQFP